MKIARVAVIGAGVMGSAIAAQIANAGVSVELLDRVDEKQTDRDAIARAAITRLLKTKPAPLMHPRNAQLIRPGNIEDDLERVATVDWVIEAVIEDLAIKQGLYRKLTEICKPKILISSNTSTLPLALLTAGQSETFKKRFMITHFFNPPRYMRLLELVAPVEIDTELFDAVTEFADMNLGKGCVICKDTPGFIANRIGTFWMQTAVLQAIQMDVPVQQADTVMALFGIPKTGVFGLLDLIGLDLMPHVLKGFKQALSADDKLYQIAVLPEPIQNMIDKGYTGRKGKGGFYRLKPGEKQKIKQVIDLKTGNYHVAEKFKIQGVTHKVEDLRHFLESNQPLSRYAWRVWADTFCYAASLIPEIADDIATVDRAMRLGYNWRYGPFELLDRLGVRWFIERLQQQQEQIPALLADGEALYRVEKGKQHFLDAKGRYHPLQRAAGVMLLEDIKIQTTPILHNASASLWDIGDGVVCFEMHSKMNTLDPDNLGLLQQSIDKVTHEYRAMVIYNEADNFSAGANLTLLAPAIQAEDWDTVKAIIHLGQNSYRMLKYAPFPVVGAPTGLALGGGCEILLHCDAIQAHAELYMGLVEVGVGLVPAWGGCKELLRRWMSHPKIAKGPIPPIAKTFELIGMAKVSQSAQEARDFLFLAETDGITMNRDRLLSDAKSRAIELAEQYQPPESPVFYLPGKSGWAAFDIALHNMYLSGQATAYDVVIGRHLATVLSGGDTDIIQPLSEQELLDLELEAFLALLKNSQTLARLAHMLKTGKPLKN